MKKLFCLILVLTFVMSVPTFAVDAIKVHEWKLEDNLDDTSGSGNNGTMEGDPQYVQGLVGQCLEFNSSDDLIKNTSASNIPTAGTAAWSINMYLYGDAKPDWTLLGGFGDWNASVNGEARYLIHGSQFQFWGYYVDKYFGPSWITGEWQMGTVTFSGAPSNTMKFYLNGQERYSETVSTLTNADARVYLAPPLWGKLFAGRIDEFTIWAGALTQAQINNLKLVLGSAKKAWTPSPVDGAPVRTGYRAVDPAVVTSWKAPLDVINPTYNVYLGTTPGNLVLQSQNQTENSFDPYGSTELNENTNYYWRVDVNDPNGGNPVIHTGDTWSFKTWASSATKVLEWKMDSSSGTVANDSTSNNNDGTLLGNPQWVEGLVGNCLQFDGDTDAVEIVNADNLPTARTDAWSINVYLYSWWLQNNKIIAGFGDPNCQWGQARYLMNADDERFQFWGQGIDEYAEAVFDIGEWQMLTITYEGSDANDWGEMRIYKNGVEKAYQWVNFYEHNALAKAYLSPGVWGNYFSGKIDEFTIWDGALMPTQIEQLTESLPVPGDISDDGDVNFEDLAIFAAGWQRTQ